MRAQPIMYGANAACEGRDPRSFLSTFVRVNLTTGMGTTEEPETLYLPRHMGGWNIFADVLLRESLLGVTPWDQRTSSSSPLACSQACRLPACHVTLQVLGHRCPAAFAPVRMMTQVMNNCVLMSLFLAYSAEENMEIAEAATGCEVSAYELLKVGERVPTLARVFNVRGASPRRMTT